MKFSALTALMATSFISDFSEIPKVNAYTEEEKKQYEEYCKVNDCSAYDENDMPPQPDPSNMELSFKCLEFVVADQCVGAKYVMN